MRRAVRTVTLGFACAAIAASAAVSRFTVDLPGALGVEFGSAPQRVVRLELFMRGKDIEGLLVTSIARNPALAGWDARDVSSTLDWKGAVLSGVVNASITPAGSGNAVPWKCVISAEWKNGGIEGRASSSVGITSMSGTEFVAKPVKLEETRGDDGFMEVILPGSGGSPGVHAGIEFRGGKPVSAASFGPLIHPVWQSLDVSNIGLSRGKVGGKLSWTPIEAGEDGVASAPEPLELRTSLRGRFASLQTKGGRGVVLLSELPKLGERYDVELAFDAPLAGGERWRRRVVARFEVSHGSSKATAFFNGRADPDWNAVIDRANFVRDGDRASGVIEATVASATVHPGFYRIQFSGNFVGAWIAGTFSAELAGAKVSEGRFTGWAAPVDR